MGDTTQRVSMLAMVAALSCSCATATDWPPGEERSRWETPVRHYVAATAPLSLGFTPAGGEGETIAATTGAGLHYQWLRRPLVLGQLSSLGLSAP